METVSGTSIDRTGKRSGLGRCKHFFWLGVLFDTVGVAVLFTGVFADLLFYDMLLYLGSIIIFFSLLWWVSWYTGNIEVLPEESSKKSCRASAAPTVLHQSVSHRFSWTFESISNTFRRQQQHLRRTLRRMGILSMIVAGLEDQREAKDVRETIEDSDEPRHIREENLGPKTEDNNPEAFGSPEAGGMTPLVQPVFPPSPLDQPLPSAVLTSENLSENPSVVPSVSAQPSLATSRSQPAIPVASEIQLPVSLSSTSHPPAPTAFQSHPVVPVSPQSPSQVHEASESQPQNLPWAFQTQPPTVWASERQAMTPQTPVMPFQTVDLQVSQDVQGFQPVLPTLQTSRSPSLVQEISQNQSSSIVEVPRVPVAQAFEAAPLSSQKLSQKLPEAVASAPKTLQSVPSDSTPGSGVVKGHSLQ